MLAPAQRPEGQESELRANNSCQRAAPRIRAVPTIVPRDALLLLINSMTSTHCIE